jgi:hypothetical protein
MLKIILLSDENFGSTINHEGGGSASGTKTIINPATMVENTTIENTITDWRTWMRIS